jgi:hypothetical protein
MPLLDLALSGSGSTPAPGGGHPTAAAAAAALPRGQLLSLLTLLMDSAARAGNTVAVMQVLSHMADTGLMPSTHSMTSLLQVREAEGVWDGVGWGVHIGGGRGLGRHDASASLRREYGGMCTCCCL